NGTSKQSPAQDQQGGKPSNGSARPSNDDGVSDQATINSAEKSRNSKTSSRSSRSSVNGKERTNEGQANLVVDAGKNRQLKKDQGSKRSAAVTASIIRSAKISADRKT